MQISIGIPFYNSEPFLADAIRSVFAQTYEHWELILIDDGSTDRSLDIAQSVRDCRVRVISDGENHGLPYRLNQLIGESKYDFVGRMDADDLMSPTRFERQVEVLHANPDIDLVSTGICSLTNDNRPAGIRCPEKIMVNALDVLAPRVCGITHAAILGRKSWFLRHPYDASLRAAEDVELWLRAYAAQDLKIHLICEPLYYYREEGNVTLKKLLLAHRVRRFLFRKYGHLGYTRRQQSLAITKSFCKSAAVCWLAATGQLYRLLKRRNRSIDATTQNLHMKEIRTITKTAVPGLD